MAGAGGGGGGGGGREVDVIDGGGEAIAAEANTPRALRLGIVRRPHLSTTTINKYNTIILIGLL